MPFCDLSVRNKQVLTDVCDCGYKINALDKVITIKKMLLISDKKISFSKDDGFSSNSDNNNVNNKGLRRLTILFDDMSNIDALKVKLANLKGYDVISILPISETTFVYACEKLKNIDIITIDTSIGLKYNLSPSVVKTAIDRGVYFEALYGEAVSNQSARKFFMSGIADIGRATRGGRNLIVSSGAENKYCLRRPYDIINLLYMLGIKKSKEALTVHPSMLLAQSKRRNNRYL